MGLSISLSHALSGMQSTQKGLEVLSRNVSNVGTPGYHRQSVSLVEILGTRSPYVHTAGVERAFSEALQRHYTGEISNFSQAGVKAEFMSRVEVALGKPGDPTSLDTLYQKFETSMQTMATSPDDYTARSEVIANAQLLATNLNNLTYTVQGLREETEAQISNHVADLNRALSSLQEINNEINDQASDPTSRAAMLDERDRLVASIAEVLDVQVTYRKDDTVSLLTKSGLGLLDVGKTVFEFQLAGGLNAHSKYSLDDAENTVGQLYATTSGGLRIDLVEQGLIKSGRIAGLLELRDDILPEVQEQLDEVAAGLAMALSTIEKTVASGDVTEVTGPPDGFSVDIGDMRSGNTMSFAYTENGEQQKVKVVRVDDLSKLPLDFTDSTGVRTIGADFSGGVAAVAAALDTALGANITVSNPSGNVLQIVDDGLGDTTDILSLSTRTTVAANQGAGLSLSLFTDNNNRDFTNSLDDLGQKVGFAGRIQVNTDVVYDNTLLVKYSANSSLGDASRANQMLSQLQNMSFTASTTSAPERGNFRMTGSAQDLVNQMMNFQGASITTFNADEKTAMLSFESVTGKMEAEYGVNIDEEMARLIELQNAYSASARVVSTVQELIDNLMRI